jgi:hypothetical protein
MFAAEQVGMRRSSPAAVYDARMPIRRASMVVPLAAALVAAAVGSGRAMADPTPAQKTFTQKLLDDPKTSAGVKRMLRSKAAIVDPRSGFVDVTGDGRQDALIIVSTGGATGAVALYVFSTHGQPAGADAQTSLKVIFRLQALDDASLRINGTTLSVLEPRWRKGDDLCCPGKLRERDYVFDAKALTFRRTADRDTPFNTSRP